MNFQHWPSPNILALWHLADVNDSSGNSRTLTNNNTVTFGTGKLGNCALFGAYNSNKNLSREAIGVDLSGNASVSGWFMVETAPTTGQSQVIFEWESTTGTARGVYLDYINESGTLKFMLSAGGTLTKYTITLPLNAWMKIDINIGAICYVYLNGVFLFSGSRGTTTTALNYFLISHSTAGYGLKGRADEVVLFTAARSAQDIRRRYAFERGMLV